MTLTSFMVYITNSHNLDQPNKSYNRNKINIKAIVPKWIKTPNNQPRVMQIITPNTHNL